MQRPGVWWVRLRAAANHTIIVVSDDHTISSAVEVLDGSGVGTVVPDVILRACASVYGKVNAPVAGSGAGGDGDLRGSDHWWRVGGDFKHAGDATCVLVIDGNIVDARGKVANRGFCATGTPVIVIRPTSAAHVQHNTAIVLLPADIGDLRLQIQHLLTCDCGASLCRAAVGVADGEAVFARGEVVDKIVGSASTPGVGVGRGAGGDFCQGDDAVVVAGAGRCGRQKEGVYDGAGANFGGEGDGAAVGVGDGDFVQTRYGYILRVLLGRGVALRARPLKGERAGSASSNKSHTAWRGRTTNAVSSLYPYFSFGNCKN